MKLKGRMIGQMGNFTPEALWIASQDSGCYPQIQLVIGIGEAFQQPTSAKASAAGNKKPFSP